MKLIFLIIEGFILIFAVFGMLMVLEYLRYWKRCLQLKLRKKVVARSEAEVQNDD